MKLPVELQPGESVVLRCRRHPLYLVSKLAGVVLAAALPIVLALVIVAVTSGLSGLAGMVVGAICAIWAFYWLARGYFVWYRHRHDEWIVTDQRLIDSYKRHWFDHRLSSADLVNVQDISIRRGGLLATAFNFGDVRCETAGSESVFVLSGISHPAQVLGVIDATRDAARLDLSGGPRRSARRTPADPESTD